MSAMSRSHYFAMILPVAFAATITWFGVFTMVNAYLVKGLGYTDEGWASAALWLQAGIVFWLLVVGEISSRIGRRATVALALVVAGIAFRVIAVSDHLWLIGPMLWLMAIVQAALSIALVSLLTRHGGEKPGRAIAVYQWVVTAVTVVSLIVGGYFMDAGRFSETFTAISLLIILSAASFYFLSKPLAPFDREGIVSLFRLKKQDWRMFLSAPFLPVLLLGTCGETWYFVMVNNLFPNLAREHFHMSESQIGWIVALGKLPSLLSLYFLTHRADHINVRLAYGVGMIIAAVLSIAMGWAPIGWMLVAAYAIYFIGQGVVWGVNITTVSSAVPMHLREAALGLLVIVQMGFALLIGALHRKMLSESWGFSLKWIFTWCALAGLASGIALAVYAVKNPGKTTADPGNPGNPGTI
jgi:MFS family permease